MLRIRTFRRLSTVTGKVREFAGDEGALWSDCGETIIMFEDGEAGRSNTNQQARVENAIYRYKQLIGGRLRSRNINAQTTEVRLAVNALNRMLELGTSRSEPIHN